MIFPEGYKPKLDFYQTERGIKLVKDTFERELADRLNLIRVSAPRFLMVGDGLQDDLAGTQEPVGFYTKFSDKKIEMVHSLAKWKRYVLGKRGFEHGTGLYTDMDAIRKDEEVSPIHSIYVDQWDWERVISKEERQPVFLQEIVTQIYEAILGTEKAVAETFPHLEPKLPEKITFVHTEDVRGMYPHLSPKRREDEAAKLYGALFLRGIGHPLKSGKPHDLRAADYDDWITETEDKRGLNGDIIIWDDVRKKSLELSSMGIRVDAESLLKQLRHSESEERKELDFHKAVLEDRLPLSIGGGIGQSRLCQTLLQKAHIGEVQSSVWPEEVEQEFEKKGVDLL